MGEGQATSLPPQSRGRLGVEMVEDGKKRSDLEGGIQRESREGLGTAGLWAGRSWGEGSMEGPPTPFARQTHPTRGFSSSKMTHVHTHG